MKVKFLLLGALCSTLIFACTTTPVKSPVVNNETVTTNPVVEEKSQDRTLANIGVDDCMAEAERNGCWFSNSDARDYKDYTNQCRTFESSSKNTR